MQTLLPPSRNSHLRIKRFIDYRANRFAPKWWTPVWRGLSADPKSKHRLAMGPSVWLFLYLLSYANRKTGLVRRRIDQIVADTAYPRRTIQRNLERLVQKDYISLDRSHRELNIIIKRWKGFHVRAPDSTE